MSTTSRPCTGSWWSGPSNDGGLEGRMRRWHVGCTESAWQDMGDAGHSEAQRGGALH